MEVSFSICFASRHGCCSGVLRSSSAGGCRIFLKMLHWFWSFWCRVVSVRCNPWSLLSCWLVSVISKYCHTVVEVKICSWKAFRNSYFDCHFIFLWLFFDWARCLRLFQEFESASANQTFVCFAISLMIWVSMFSSTGVLIDYFASCFPSVPYSIAMFVNHFLKFDLNLNWSYLWRHQNS